MTKQQTEPAGPTGEPLLVAEQLVRRAEGLERGTPEGDVADAIGSGRQETKTTDVANQREVSPPDVEPAPIDALTEVQLCIATSGPPFESRTAALLELHAHALDKYPALAQVARSWRVEKLVIREGLQLANGEPGSGEAARDRWIRAISAQIVERPGHELFDAARIVAEVVPELYRRLDRVEQRHREYAAEEAKRQREADAAREQARLAKERTELLRGWRQNLQSEDRDCRDRRENLAEFFKKHAAYEFTIDGKPMTGKACETDLLLGAPLVAFFRAQTSGQKPRARMRG